MYFYFCILLICSAAFYLINQTHDIRAKKLIYYLGPVLILIFVLGFREDVGIDFKQYKFIFNNIESIKGIEKGYYYLNLLIKNIGLPFFVVTFISALVTNLLVFITIKNHSKLWFISFFLFFTDMSLYFKSFIAIQQFIAISIFFFSVKYIIDRSIFKFLFCVFIGFFFHKSIIFVIPFYFLLNFNYGKFQMIIILVASYIAQKLDVIILFLRYISFYIPGSYEKYINSIVNKRASFNTGLSFLFDLSLFIFIIFLIDKININKVFVNAYLYYFSIFLITQNYSTFGRMSWYFKIFSIILIPNFLYKLKPKSRNLITVILISAYLLVFWKSLYVDGVDPLKIIPYDSVFFNL